MKPYNFFKKQDLANKNKPDYILMSTVILLALMGIVMVFSATYYKALDEEKSSISFLISQLTGVGIGLILMLVLSKIDYRKWDSSFIVFVLFCISAVLLIITLIIGVATKGAVRWIEIGSFRFQPSEIARFTVLLSCASWFSRASTLITSRNKMDVIRGLIRPLAFTFVLMGLIVAGKSLSMVITIIALLLVMLYVAGTRLWAIVSMGAIGSGIAAIFIFFESFRMERLGVFLDPWSDPLGSGFQPIQSIYALANGGIFGVGLGNSLQKFRFLPDADTDFILSIIGEELGFIGIIGIMIAFIIILWRGTLIAQRAPTKYGMLVAYGTVAIILIQVIINIGVVSSFIPATGLPLPFISRGNTSLVIFFSEIGILLNISKHSRKI